MKERNLFDRFASIVSANVARAWFFALCVLIVVAWVPTLAVMDVNTSQLIINTLTTIVTFLLVALMQNDQQRFEEATLERLARIEAGLTAHPMLGGVGR